MEQHLREDVYRAWNIVDNYIDITSTVNLKSIAPLWWLTTIFLIFPFFGLLAMGLPLDQPTMDTMSYILMYCEAIVMCVAVRFQNRDHLVYIAYIGKSCCVFTGIVILRHNHLYREAVFVSYAAQCICFMGLGYFMMMDVAYNVAILLDIVHRKRYQPENELL